MHALHRDLLHGGVVDDGRELLILSEVYQSRHDCGEEVVSIGDEWILCDEYCHRLDCPKELPDNLEELQ